MTLLGDRRERLAITAMHALLSSGTADRSPRAIALAAIVYADALAAALDGEDVQDESVMAGTARVERERGSR